MTLCVVCQARTDAALCDNCTAEITKTLAEIPADLTNLTAVATRQAAGPLGLGDSRAGRQWDGPLAEGSLGDAPWVYAPGAADQLWALDNTLTTWARHIAETHDLELPAVRPPERFTVTTRLTVRRNRMHLHVDTQVTTAPHEPAGLVAARWLLAHAHLIRVDQAAYEIHDELTALAAENTLWTFGRSVPTLFAGKCDAPDVRVDFTDGATLTPRVSTCGADLYAHEGDDDVRCQTCGHTYRLEQRRALILEKMNDQWCRAQLIADSLTTNDEPINASTLRTWIERDAKLTVHGRATVGRPLILQVGIDDDGQPLYLVSDVRARIAWSRERTKSERISA